MPTFDSIDQNFNSRDRFARARITQRDVEPTAIKQRQINAGKLFLYTNVFTFTNLLTLSNGEDETVTFTFSHNKEYELITPEVYVAYYHGSVASANQLPGGSGVTESNWVWASPWFDYGGFSTNKYVSAVSVYVRNVSAGASQNVSFVLRAKTISQAPF